MGRIKDYFVERGLTPADFPVAFVFHEVISVGWAGAVWGACYGIQPSVRCAGRSRSCRWRPESPARSTRR